MEAIRAIFPDTDVEVCKAILAANGGNVEAAINALLEMQSSGTTANVPDTPRGTHDDEALARAIAQQEEDEELARRLEEEDRAAAQATRQRSVQNSNGPGTPDAFRETKEKVVAGANALGETAKKKFQEAKAFYDRTFNQKSDSGHSPTSRQQYSNLPEKDDFDSLIDNDAPDSPLGARRL